MRDGVSASRVAVTAGPGTRVVDFLQARMPMVNDWAERLAKGDVLDAQGGPLGPEAVCAHGLLLWYWRRPPPEPRVPFEIEVLHQDAQLVVVDKPHFLSVTPGGRHLHETVLVRLKRLLGISTLVPLHRLDRETAGVLLFSVRPADRAAYHALLRERQVHKVYEAVAPWRPEICLPMRCQHRLVDQAGDRFMQVQVEAGVPNAETHIDLIRRLGPQPGEAELALYRLTPVTGRRHQLRVQLNALGLPIVGDRIYPRLLPEPPEGAEPDYHQPLQLLAREIAFVDPLSGERRHYTSRRGLQRAG